MSNAIRYENAVQAAAARALSAENTACYYDGADDTRKEADRAKRELGGQIRELVRYAESLEIRHENLRVMFNRGNYKTLGQILNSPASVLND